MIIKCPQCHEELEVEEAWVGRKAQCPYCETKFMIQPPNKPQVKPVQQPKSIAPKLVVQQRSPLPRSTVRHTEELTRTVNRPAQTAPVPDRQRVLDLLCQKCASATAEARSVFWAVLLIMTSLAVAGHCYFAWYVWMPISMLIFPLASAIGKNVLIRHRMDVTALGAPTTDNRVWFLFDEATRRRTQYEVSWSDSVGSGDYADVTRETHGQIEQFVQPSPTCLTTASNAPSYDLGSGTLVLLRDAAFYVGGFYPTMCVLPYSGFWVQQKDAYVRRLSNPQDGSGVSVSWEHERVNGGPDRRFKSNTATYMCSYELISYSAKSANGKHDIQGGILLSQN